MRVRELKISNMWAMMHRLQDEDAPVDDDDEDEDEIYGLCVVVQRDATGKVDDVIVVGSEVYLTITEADREQWLLLPPSDTWLQQNFPVDARLDVTWTLLEEDSILDTDIGEAITELTEGLLEEFAEELPGIKRIKALYRLINKFIAKVTSDDNLGSWHHVFDLSADPEGVYAEAFPCRAADAYYHGYASATLGPPRDI